MSAAAINDRRMRATETGQDTLRTPVLFEPAESCALRAIDAAVETATRVRITHDVVMAFIDAPDDVEDIAGPLAAAFEAAGFEVEK